MVAQSAMSVFHTGIIGSGLREKYIRAKLSDERIKLNTQHLMNAVYSCCLQSSNGVFLDAVINIALLLVQLISPDVMFNGLPWPEEEFCKVCVLKVICCTLWKRAIQLTHFQTNTGDNGT
jgi:integrator complex subunit 5